MSTWRPVGPSRPRRPASIERAGRSCRGRIPTARTPGTRCHSARRRASSTFPFTCRISSSTTTPVQAVADDDESWHRRGVAIGRSGRASGGSQGGVGDHQRPPRRVGPGRRARGRGVRSGRARQTAACSPPPAASCFKGPAKGNSSPSTPEAARRSGLLRRRPVCSRLPSPMKSPAGNTSPSWWVPAVRGRRPATRPTRKATACPTSLDCWSTRSAARRRCPRPAPSRPATGSATRDGHGDDVGTRRSGVWDVLRQVPRPRGRGELRHSSGSALQRHTRFARGLGRRRPRRAVRGERHGLVCVSGRRGRRGGHSRLRHRAGACRASVAGRARAVRWVAATCQRRANPSHLTVRGVVEIQVHGHTTRQRLRMRAPTTVYRINNGAVDEPSQFRKNTLADPDQRPPHAGGIRRSSASQRQVRVRRQQTASSLRARAGIGLPVWPPMHPAGRRCSSLTYSRYARSSRLAGRAPRRPHWQPYSRASP